MYPADTTFKYIKTSNFFLIAGPCIVESKEITFEIANKVLEITKHFEIPFIFKASYRKANRTRLDSFTGIGTEEALNIIKSVGDQLKIPVLTDVHSEAEAVFASSYVDILQIPAFLCRQTDLILAAADTKKIINIKKGQFASPITMKYAAEKVASRGNKHIMLTERGSMFGQQDLVVDFRNIPEMKAYGFPVILDITHSLQKPNQESGVAGGDPQLIETIAKAGIAVGVDGIFLETHPNPPESQSDAKNMLKLDTLKELLYKLITLRQAIVNI